MATKLTLTALAAAAVSLSACNTAETLNTMFGNPQSEEQFAGGGGPLSLPPDFDLRPPRGGGDRAQAEVTRMQGQQIVTGAGGSGGVITAAPEQTRGETALLEEAGVRPGIDDSIRNQVDQETTGATEGEKQFANKLLNWREGESDEREDDRLGTPVIKKKGEIF